jgi:hypothetical protein
VSLGQCEDNQRVTVNLSHSVKIINNALSLPGDKVQILKFNQSCPTEKRIKTDNFGEKKLTQTDRLLFRSFVNLIVKVLLARMFM